jgi:chorismate--pyruvate lyase
VNRVEKNALNQLWHNPRFGNPGTGSVFVNKPSFFPPRWSTHRRWTHGRVPRHLVRWLLDSGSLTDRLKRSCCGRFEVRIIGEGWRRPRLDEARALGLSCSCLGWVREVQLLCAGQPWVFARTVIPVTTLRGRERRLSRLGNRPLGAFLFADPGMQREEVELARIDVRHAMFREATIGLKRRPELIWGRRSVFRVGGKPLLVTEVFLPTIGSLT